MIDCMEDSDVCAWILAMFPNAYSDPTDRREAVYFARYGLVII